MKNKRILMVGVPTLFVVGLSFIVLTMTCYNNKDKLDTKDELKNRIDNLNNVERFAIYKETTFNNFEYVNETAFPNKGYLLNEEKTKCYEYGTNKEVVNAVAQSLTNGSIDGSIIVESTKSIYCNIYFDKDDTLPTISTFTITGKDSKGTPLTNGYTYDTNVTYKIDWQDNDVVSYCINDTTSCSNWIELTDKTLKTISVSNSTYTSSNGVSKNVSVYLKDKANNISVVQTKSITVDQTNPTVELTLKGTQESGTLQSGYTHTKEITYTANITEDNIEGYCISESDCNSYTSVTEKVLTNNSYTLTDTEGSHSVTIKVKDKAGNTGSAIQTIALDKTAPTVTNLASKSKDKTSITVSVDGSDSTPGGSIIKKECRTNGGNWVSQDSSGNCKITGLQSGTTYTIEGRVTDKSGRISTNNKTISVATDKAITYSCDGIGGTLSGTRCVQDAWPDGETVWDIIKCGDSGTEWSKNYSSLEECEDDARNDECAIWQGSSVGYCVQFGNAGEIQYESRGDLHENPHFVPNGKYWCDSGWTLSGTKCYKDAKQI